ncbi:MaoC/PaaZ C-terminal domain-containing protein [Marinobacter sp. SS21]|uniref:MaoC/PaaZ C-terminal domain-containing protein n=1 Tax=Marinobacter sp. SS21 TaxID=2979460 RepID=UPI00232E3AD3|nr:MaoC/PaaZ C-terminal domain-containing protein [Marinobacter sp. SS21]MDC0662966.1 MaoC/PaaZ C-terminal domain-containing protein [Marinobacter sp. SS21]
MTINYQQLLNRKFEPIEHHYSEKDSMLYALGVGLGIDPLDEDCLPFVYEDGLKAFPSMAVVLAYPGFWAKEPDTGIDWVKLLHAGQEVILHKPLPATGRVEATTRITDIVDKGEGKGALIISERVVRDQDSGEALCTLITTAMARGDGGFGGPAVASPKPDPIPEREPDLLCDLPTLAQAALIYRLSGDFNPLHASPAVARDAGFKAPILHGLCTFGVATHALLKTLCDYDPTRLQRLRVRFSSPVYPGETIRTEIWRNGNEVAFRCRVVERDVVVINNGYAEVG